MREVTYYAIADHMFSLAADKEDLRLMDNYAPFHVVNPCAFGETVFSISLENGEIPAYFEELRQVEEDQTIICGKTSTGQHMFEFLLRGESAGCLVCSDDYREGELILTGMFRKYAIDNALMVIYALATADNDTALFHAAVVSYQGKGYMFLGPSGTGKSTHARLWQQSIGGVELVNDDNPVVRVSADGKATVYGSPWSGKTPCYRNVRFPLAAIVMLSQAPHNKMERWGGVSAYVALMQSISGTRWDKKIADGLHKTENELAQRVAMWHLECLPDVEAAHLCKSKVTADD